MPGIKELKTRIKSIGSTRKITRAMQMVSAAKMRKAQSATLASRTYSTLAWDLILDLSIKIFTNNPLFKTYPKSKKVGVVILGSNRGFVGSLNTNLMGILKNYLAQNQGQDHEVLSEVVVYGKKAENLAKLNRLQVSAVFEKQDKTTSAADIYPLAQHLVSAYSSGKYSKIVIVYNHFISTISQKPSVKQLFPFAEEGVHVSTAQMTSEYEDARENLSAWQGGHIGSAAQSDYLFEPTPGKVLDHLLPRIVESQIYQTILESDASEHSARMVMMKNATEAAGDLISDLTLAYNQLRQNKITTELAEITAGKIALE